MKKIGDILRETRERQGLSIEDVAVRTKIHRHKLVAIEEGDKDSLPAQVFAVGLIKSYARELKVDLRLIDDLCREAYADEPPPSFLAPIPTSQTVRVADAPEERQSVGLFQVPKILMILVSLFFIAALTVTILFVSQKMSSYSEEESQTESFVDIPEDEVTPVPPAAVEENPKQMPGEEEPEKSSKPSEDKVEESSPASNSRPASVVATPIPETPTLQSPPPVAEQAPTAEAPTLKKIEKTPVKVPTTVVASADQKLSVRALEPVRIEIIWSDGYNQGLLLKSGESKTLVFSSPIRMRIDNGGAVDIVFNDKKRGVPGELNKAIELTFP